MAVAHSRGADSDAPDLWDGLVLDLPIAAGGGTTAYDVSGYDNHGTLTNMDPATDWVASPYGWVLDFVRTDSQYVNLPTNAKGLELTASGGTLWVLCRQTEAVNAIHYGLISRTRTSNTLTSAYSLRTYDDARKLRGQLQIGAELTSVVSAFELNAWNSLAHSWDGTNQYLWVNGKLVGQQVQDGVPAYTPPTFAYIGRSKNTYFHGQIASAGIYNRALALSEIQQLYADPQAMHRLRRRIFASAVAPGGLSIPIAMHHYTKNIVAA